MSIAKWLAILYRMEETSESKVSEGGMFFAALLALMATLGHFLTLHSSNTHDAEWFSIFGLSLFMLCAAAVNFDPKRWLR